MVAKDPTTAMNTLVSKLWPLLLKGIRFSQMWSIMVQDRRVSAEARRRSLTLGISHSSGRTRRVLRGSAFQLLVHSPWLELLLL